MSNSKRNRAAAGPVKTIRGLLGGTQILAAEGDSKPRKIRMSLYTGAPIRQYSWSDPIVIDLNGVKFSDKPRPVLMNHSTALEDLVGTTDSIRVDATGITVDATLNGYEPKASQIAEMAARGVPFQSSIGADVIREEYVRAGDKVTVNGNELTGPLVIAREVELKEASIVALGADDATSTTLAAMRAANESKENRTMAAENVNDTPAPAPIDIKAETEKVIKAQREAAAAEQTRIAAISEVAKDQPKILAQAIAEGWDATKTELAVLRAARPTAPAAHVKGDANANIAASIEAGLVLSATRNEDKVAKQYGEAVMKDAIAASGRGIKSIIARFLRAHGEVVDGVGEREIRAAMQLDRGIREGRIEASSGFSTIGLSGLLGNAANKVLLDSFTQFRSVVNAIAGQRDVVDFKQTTAYRLTATGEAEIVPQNGELPLISMTEEAYSNRARTRGFVTMLTREQILNDDLNAFAAIPRLAARHGYLAREKAVIALLAGSSGTGHFSSGNGNFFSGADTALGVASLTRAHQTFLGFTDTNGEPIGVTPSILLAPPGLAVLAQQLFADRYVNQTPASNAAATDGNPHAGLFTPVVSPFLANAKITGNSNTAWYLLANPAELATVEVVYVEGRRAPTIEAVEPDFQQLGMGFRTTYEFGAALHDPKGAVKFAGA
jgi:phage head maturation protease